MFSHTCLCLLGGVRNNVVVKLGSKVRDVYGAWQMRQKIYTVERDCNWKTGFVTNGMKTCSFESLKGHLWPILFTVYCVGILGLSVRGSWWYQLDTHQCLLSTPRTVFSIHDHTFYIIMGSLNLPYNVELGINTSSQFVAFIIFPFSNKCLYCRPVISWTIKMDVGFFMTK